MDKESLGLFKEQFGNYYENKNYNKKETIMSKIKLDGACKKMSNNDLYQQAHDYYNEEKFLGAILCCNKIIERNPIHRKGICLKGAAFSRRGFHIEAIACCNEVIELSFDHDEIIMDKTLKLAYYFKIRSLTIQKRLAKKMMKDHDQKIEYYDEEINYLKKRN